MKELEVLGVVRITKETIPNGKGKHGDCITLVDRFQWLLKPHIILIASFT
jgi:hypothetical protein